jgi:hypothetical protein
MATNTICEQTAIDWITAWRNSPQTGVKAFFIPKDDMSDLMLDDTCIGVRAYLAYGNEDGLPAEAKLLLVDVDGNINTGGTDNLANGIFDFTSPCPNFCDVTSPLYTLIETKVYPIIGGNAIELAMAIAWEKAWMAKPDLGVKAFFIPKDDIQDLLNDDTCIGARAYLGFGTTDPNDPTQPAESKLMLVSVDPTDKIPDNGKDNIENGIYDFTSPCPNFCDISSSLYTLKP